MTSRSSSWGNNEHIFKLEVGVFTEDEAMLFLTMNAAEFQQESIGEIKDTFWKTLHHLFCKNIKIDRKSVPETGGGGGGVCQVFHVRYVNTKIE